MQDTITIPANATQVYKTKGSFFGVISCTAPFQLEAERRGRRDMVGGRRFGGEAFKRLTFINNSASANTIVFEAGNSELDISSAISADVETTGYIKDAPTSLVCSTETEIENAAELFFLGTGGQRKQIVICNGSTTAGDVLTVTDEDGVVIGAFIQPGQTFTLITSAALGLTNNSGNTIPIAVLETFYT